MDDLIERLRDPIAASEFDGEYEKGEHIAVLLELCIEAAAALEAAQEDACVALVADIRFACGDDGKRMQPELVEFVRELAADAERLEWLLTKGKLPVRCSAGYYYEDGVTYPTAETAIDQARRKEDHNG